MCTGLTEREESGWFVRELLAKSPALQNIWHFWASSVLCPLWFCTPLVPRFGSVFSLSCRLLRAPPPAPCSIVSVPSWFSSLFSSTDFLCFFLLTRKIHFNYLSAHNWQWDSLDLTFILSSFQNFCLVHPLLCEIPKMQLFPHLTLASSLDFPF